MGVEDLGWLPSRGAKPQARSKVRATPHRGRKVGDSMIRKPKVAVAKTGHWSDGVVLGLIGSAALLFWYVYFNS